jgi:hypothetical protein
MNFTYKIKKDNNNKELSYNLPGAACEALSLTPASAASNSQAPNR